MALTCVACDEDQRQHYHQPAGDGCSASVLVTSPWLVGVCSVSRMQTDHRTCWSWRDRRYVTRRLVTADDRVPVVRERRCTTCHQTAAAATVQWCWSSSIRMEDDACIGLMHLLAGDARRIQLRCTLDHCQATIRCFNSWWYWPTSCCRSCWFHWAKWYRVAFELVILSGLKNWIRLRLEIIPKKTAHTDAHMDTSWEINAGLYMYCNKVRST